MKRIKILLLEFLVFVLIVPVMIEAETIEKAKGNAKNSRDSGYQLYFKSNFEGAAKEFRKAIELNPINEEYHFLLAKSLHKQKLSAQAIDEIRYAVGIKPDYEQAHLLLGDIYFEGENWQEAEKSYLKVIELNSKNFDARFKVGQVYIKIKRVDDAITHLKQAKELNGDEPYVSFYLGQAYLEKEEISLAVSSFDNAIRLQTNNPLFYYWRGNAFFAAGDYRDPNDYNWRSVVDYQQTIEFGLSTPYVYFMLGNTLLNRAFYCLTVNRTTDSLDLLERSIVKYQEVIALEPAASNAYNNLGLAYYYLGRWDEAIVSYKKAIDLEPVVAFFHDNLADVYYKKAEFNEAIAQWKLIQELDSNYMGSDVYFPTSQKPIKEKLREAQRRK
ncbi:MAG: tetratricopeptide repeat protein [Nitrospirota bacterium]